MAAMTFVTPARSGRPVVWPGAGRDSGGVCLRHWIFLINLPVGIIGAIATLTLMPNYKMQTRRFDFFGFILLAAGMATLTSRSTGKGPGISLPVARRRW